MHRQRHGEAVVDRHLVDERQVELVEDQRLGEVPRQIGMPLTTGTGRGPNPSSAISKSAAMPERERGDELQREGVGVVVVDDDARHPGAAWPSTPRPARSLAKYGAQYGSCRLALVDGRTHGRDVRRADAADDLSHGPSPRRCARPCCGCPRSGARRTASSSTYSSSVTPVCLARQLLERHAVERGQLVRVVDVAPELEQAQPVASEHRLALLGGEGEAIESTPRSARRARGSRACSATCRTC